jgi:hypothetical protein
MKTHEKNELLAGPAEEPAQDRVSVCSSARGRKRARGRDARNKGEKNREEILGSRASMIPLFKK